MSVARPINGQQRSAAETLTHGEPPPGAPEAEAQLIGAALLVPAHIPLIDAAVSHRDWTDARCRTAWSHLMAMHAAGERIDAVSLLLHCRAAGDEEALGGSAQLARWLTDCICPSDPRDKIAIVAERGAKREAFFALIEGARACQSGRALGEVLGGVRGRLDAIGSASGAALEYEVLTPKYLADNDFTIRYLVDQVVPEAQGGLISGRFKTLKTSVVADLVLSGATGTPFLGRFGVPAVFRGGLMTAEIGRPGMKELLTRISGAKGFDLRDIDGAIFSTSLPKIGNLEHMECLERYIIDNGLEFLAIDPSYLAFSDAGESASNVFMMGRLLLTLTKLIEKTRCTVMIINHNRKVRGDKIERFAPPDLSEISMSGFAEWMRFWLLLGPRREWDEETGQHWLWARTGGSAGHAGLFHLDVLEGKRSDPGGRQWGVSLLSASDGREHEQEQRAVEADRRKAAKDLLAAETLTADREAILRSIASMPECQATKSELRDRCGRNGKPFGLALAAAIENGDLTTCFIKKPNGRKYDGYQLADRLR